jgi:hypothetical protein
VAVAAFLPLVVAIVGAVTGTASVGPRSAFANAPSGLYAVALRSEGDESVVFAALAEDPSVVREVARVKHLPGYAPVGAVSPDGRTLALTVADAGTVSQPRASLQFIALDSGDVSRHGDAFDYLQAPVWAPDGSAVAMSLDGVTLARVDLAGRSTPLAEAADALGAYPVAFDAAGSIYWVRIDERGSTLLLGLAEVLHLSPFITRDWALSPDGAQVAFIEARTDGPLRYERRVAPLSPGRETFLAQAAATGQQLGVAWAPGATEPTFGQEPLAAVSETTRSQAAVGFDVPLAYSPDGAVLAVQAWTGDSFDQPGEVSLVLVSGASRVPLAGASRFLGWAAR